LGLLNAVVNTTADLFWRDEDSVNIVFRAFPMIGTIGNGHRQLKNHREWRAERAADNFLTQSPQ
jgi:hypothetical protein